MLRAMRVLIIGGTGLISTAITQQLLDRGDAVTVFNRGQTPIRVQGALDCLHGDRWQAGSLERAVEGRTWDAVIDMAAFAPENADQLVAVFWGRTAQVVLCSTVCVYGGPAAQLPIRETSPRSPFGRYGENKAAIERILLAQSGQRGTVATVLRPSFTTGEGAVANGLLFDDSLVARMRARRPVLVMDDGRTPWAIAHVADVARGFVAALGNPRAAGNDYHLTSHEHTDWNGVYRALADAAGGTAEIVHVPSEWLRRVAPRRSIGVWFIFRFPSVFDNAKAEADLGFATTVPLVETFRRQIGWMEATGRVRGVADDPCEDCLLDAWHAGNTVIEDPRWQDVNPWGNHTEN
jgi:nucleoside-diphosphate-sugar epimerase